MITDPKHWFLGPPDNALFLASTGGGTFPLVPTCDASRSGFYFSPVSRSGIGGGCCDRVTDCDHVTGCDHVTDCGAGVAVAAAPSPPPTGRGTGADSEIYRREIHVQLLQPVLRIHDILLWIRIRGSILWIRIRILSSVTFRMQKNYFFHIFSFIWIWINNI